MPIAMAERAGPPEAALFQEPDSPMVTNFPAAHAADTLEHIYSLYSSRVYYLCLHMTGNTEDAEDLSQEAFLRMMKKMGTFRGESAFYTWLRRLTVNVVLLKFQKASCRREISLEELTEPDNRLEPRSQRAFATIDLELMGAIDRINLDRAMDRLAPGLKAVLTLHDIEGYEHAEIADFLGCTVGTSKSQLHKARLRLREMLGETWREGARANQPAQHQEPATLRVPVPLGRIVKLPASSPEDVELSRAVIRQRLAA